MFANLKNIEQLGLEDSPLIGNVYYFKILFIIFEKFSLFDI